MERDGLAAFRALVVANMRHAGAIRIDHAFQLARLFLIPVGRLGEGGAYVAMPFEPMLAVLRLESYRAKCLVIAEDLGTAPEGFSDALMQAGILSYRILAFEREQEPGSSHRLPIPAMPSRPSPPTTCLPSSAGGGASTPTRAKPSGSTIPSGPMQSAASVSMSVPA